MADVQTLIAIPTHGSAPYFSQRTRLDGREFELRFSWNERERRYYLTLADSEGVPLVGALKLVANWPLLRYSRHDPRVPPGELMVIDQTGDNAPPELGELGIGRRCELTYYATTT
jgi:hypothetical protein